MFNCTPSAPHIMTEHVRGYFKIAVEFECVHTLTHIYLLQPINIAVWRHFDACIYTFYLSPFTYSQPVP